MQRGVDVGKVHVESSKRTLVKMVIVVIVLAAIVGGYYLYGTLSQKAPGGTSGQVIEAPAGSVTPGFPSALLLEKGVSVKESYTVNYSGLGVSQLVASYVSGLPMAKNVELFKNYLSGSNWVISHDANVSSPVTYFVATRGGENVNITLATDGATKKIAVTIAYVNIPK